MLSRTAPGASQPDHGSGVVPGPRLTRVPSVRRRHCDSGADGEIQASRTTPCFRGNSWSAPVEERWERGLESRGSVDPAGRCRGVPVVKRAAWHTSHDEVTVPGEETGGLQRRPGRFSSAGRREGWDRMLLVAGSVTENHVCAAGTSYLNKKTTLVGSGLHHKALLFTFSQSPK